MNNYTDDNFILAPAANSRMSTLRGLSSISFENGTLRGFSSVPREIQDLPPHVELVPAPRAKPKPEVAISNFKIEFDHGEKYHPGMDIKGKVVMDVWSSVTIRYVEFVLEGKATARIFKAGSKFVQRTKTETYLHKKILLLQPANGKPSMTLSPGKYVSTFMYKLPANIPSTVRQADLGGGHVFSITYSAQANVCDFIPNSKYGRKNDKYARVVKSIKSSFIVVPDTDYQSVPGALDPISHAEQVNLLCGCLSGESTSVLVKLNHQVYTVGDIMRLHLEIYTPNPNRIGEIEAQFEQKIVIRCGSDNQVRNKRTLIRAVDTMRERKYKTETRISEHTVRKQKNHENIYKTGFKIPIPGNIIPSLLPYSRIVDIYYFMAINISFRKLGGHLQLRIPLTITPAMDPDIHQQQSQHIPLFNKPIIQFPHFAKKNPLRESRVSLSSTTTIASQESTLRKFKDKKQRRKHEKVRVTHKNFLGF